MHMPSPKRPMAAPATAAARHRPDPNDGAYADEDRGSGAPADVGVPPPEDRRRAGEVVDPFCVGVDQRGDDAEVQMRNDECHDDQDHADGDCHRLPTTDAHVRQPIGAGRRHCPLV